MAASVVYDPRWQLIDGDGHPYPNATLGTFSAGTDDELAVYQDSDLTIPHANPVQADADGRFPLMFMAPVGYKFLAHDEDDVQVWSADHVSDPGTIFAENFGTSQTADAALNVTAGYVVTASNLFVTVASSGATVVNLPAVGDRTQPVCIKNVGAGTVVITCNGLDVIDGSLATFTLEAAATPLFPAVWLYPGIGSWWIFASHRAA